MVRDITVQQQCLVCAKMWLVIFSIKNQNQKAIYTYCASHRLNLCVARCCDIPSVSRAIDHAKSIGNFFNNSPIRASFLSNRFSEKGLKKTKLDNPSLTRWIARIASLDGFLDGNEIQLGQKGELPHPWRGRGTSQCFHFLSIYRCCQYRHWPPGLHNAINKTSPRKKNRCHEIV